MARARGVSWVPRRYTMPVWIRRKNEDCFGYERQRRLLLSSVYRQGTLRRSGRVAPLDDGGVSDASTSAPASVSTANVKSA